MAIKITLDPGHGQYDNKSSNNPKYIEGTQMWKLANKLKAALEKYGFEVVTTRPKISDNPSLSARGKTAGQNGSSMLLSLHSNAPAPNKDGTYSPSVTGSVVIYSLTDKNNKALADKLGVKVSELMDHHYRGSTIRESTTNPGTDYYGVIRAAAQSGCKCAYIIEHGFHTNVKDSNFLLSDTNLQILADAEAKIIADHFGAKSVDKAVNSVNINLPVLKRGSKGEEVKTVQRLLKAMGYTDSSGNALEIDGSFGAKTEYAVKAFQSAEKISADGVIGSDTWNRLLK